MKIASRHRRRPLSGPKFDALEARSLLSGIGDLDPGLGGRGYVALSVSAGDPAAPTGVLNAADAVQRDGRVVLAGSFSRGGRDYLAVARVEPDGSPDPGFGRDGRASVAVDSSHASSVVIQDDGRILVAGTASSSSGPAGVPDLFVVARFDVNGNLDKTYGTDGVARIRVGATGDHPPTGLVLAGAALQDDGRLVLAGDIPPGPGQGFVAARLDASGKLDTSFAGDGIATVPVTVRGSTDDRAVGVAIQGDGKVVLGGSARAPLDPIGPGSIQAYIVPALVRLNPDGTPDASLGDPSAPGVVVLPDDPANPANGGDFRVRSFALQPDGGILLGGTDLRNDASGKVTGGPALIRVDPDGKLDARFGAGGLDLLPASYAPALAEADPSSADRVAGGILIQPDGQIVLAGPGAAATDKSPATGPAVARLNPDGTPDKGFGNTGTPGLSTFPGLVPAGFSASAVAIQPDGNLVLAGSGRATVDGSPALAFAAARVRAQDASSNAGMLDPGVIGGLGYVSPAVSGVVVAQADGKFLVVGQAGPGASPNAPVGFVLERFNADGSPDPGFGQDGRLAVASGLGFPVRVGAAAVQADGKIVLAGVPIPASTPGGRDLDEFVVARLDADGTLDTSFGSGGIARVAVGLASPPDPGSASVGGLAIGPDGTIVVAGGAVDPSGSGSDFAAVRLDARGRPDPSFGTDGRVLVAFADATGAPTPPPSAPAPFSQARAVGVAIQADGKIVLGGSAEVGPPLPPGPAGPGAGAAPAYRSDAAAVRLNPDGTLDTAFGGPSAAGKVLVPPLAADPQGPRSIVVTGFALNPDGTIVLGGDGGPGSGRFVAVRLAADGTPDASFGHDGRAVLAVASPLDTVSAGGLAVQLDGSILIGGEVGPASAATPAMAEFAAARFTPDGTPDETFGATSTPGLAEYPSFLAPQGIAAPTLTALPDGNVLLAGERAGPDAITPSFVVARISTLAPIGIGAWSGGIGSGTGAGGIGTGAGSGGIETAGGGTGTAAGGTSTGTAAGGTSTGTAAGPTTVGGAHSPIPARPGPTADYDGSGRSNLAVYLPAAGAFAYRPTAGGPDILVPFGIPGPGRTIPAPGDYTGAGHAEIAAYLPDYGVYAIRPAGGGPDITVPFGIPGAGRSIPAPGDYGGTGRDDIAVYLPDFAAFGIRPSGGGPDRIVPFGIAGPGQSLPAPADYFGTGRDDIAVYLAALGAFAVRPPGGGADVIVPFGIPGVGRSIPVPGDYDGSGRTELAVYMPALGIFAYRPANGGPDVLQAFGSAGDGSVPVPGDYSGSGHAEIAVFDPVYGSFAYRPGRGGPDVIVPFGSAGMGQSLAAAAPAAALLPPVPVTPTTTPAAVPPGGVATVRTGSVPAGPLASHAGRRPARPRVPHGTPARSDNSR